MRITRVEIRNYKGIEHKVFDVGPGGAVIKGKNRSGKTSVLDGIMAGLAARGVGPECIRQGADRAEILIDLDHASVRRVIRRSGNNELKTDGLGLGKPQSRLDDLFGNLLDPWALAMAKPAERMRMILSAMPAKVTAEDLKRWTGDDWSPSEGKHGLDVIADIRKHYYDLRTAANKDAKAAAEAFKAARAEADALASDAHKGVVVPLAGEEEAPVRDAEAARKQLDQRKRDAEAMASRAQGIREKISKLRASAKARLDESPGPTSDEVMEALQEACRSANAEVERIEEMLRAAQAMSEAADAAWNAASDRNEAHERHLAQAKEWTDQADDLEATLAATTIEAPSPDDFAASDAAIIAARAHAELVRAARMAHDADVRAATLAEEAQVAQAEADHLGDIVNRLTSEAPTELAERAQMIRGLTFVDGDIALDGKVFGVLCESEKISLCVEVAKRMNPEGKVLRVDKLEQIDPDTMEGFVKVATAGGWQLLGTRVERGDLVIEAIEPGEDDASAPAPAQKPKTSRLTVVMPEGEDFPVVTKDAQ